ncbi:hypothetical protein L249_3611 [Ophiocordyceps polyrhachis-furcata BCC 54312]|uniref:Uncharacterized protein n=1 Tax=Ophiocordyceps polyrhachis-furcata BCC 54312 TaxID=1330021 RepID=A0A367LMC5_9HYPO|nr:hypothetical protein L249_3611 [Ophiocordyceps polyrhachis-furcata BCC 54312]
MASRRCEFRLSLPADHRIYSTGFLPRSSSISPRSPRSPRFHEDFDAPFSEALLNASQTTFASDASDSVRFRHSIDVNAKQSTPPSTAYGAQQTPPSTAHSTRSPTRQVSWQAAEPNMRSSLNSKLRGWARRSLTLGRKRNHDVVDFSHVRHPSFKGPTD